MGQYIKNLTAFTFTGTSTTSNAIGDFDDCRSVSISIITTTGTTFTVQVEPTPTGTDFMDLQSGGADVTVTASEGLVIEPVPFRQMRLLATAASTGTDAQSRGIFVI